MTRESLDVLDAAVHSSCRPASFTAPGGATRRRMTLGHDGMSRTRSGTVRLSLSELALATECRMAARSTVVPWVRSLTDHGVVSTTEAVA